MDHRLDSIETRIERIEELGQKIDEVETSLHKAFHTWARPIELRGNQVVTMIKGLEERLALAEQRISELEFKRTSLN